jgi:ubiquinone/menaquinone biosynthesis C-methylase UbiE
MNNKNKASQKNRHDRQYKKEYNTGLNMNIYYSAEIPKFSRPISKSDILKQHMSNPDILKQNMSKPDMLKQDTTHPAIFHIHNPQRINSKTKLICEFAEKIVDSYLWKYPNILGPYKQYIGNLYKSVDINNIRDKAVYSKLHDMFINMANQYNCPLIDTTQYNGERGDNRIKSIIKYVISRQPASMKIDPTCYLDIGCFDGGITQSIAKYFNLNHLQTHGVDIADYGGHLTAAESKVSDPPSLNTQSNKSAKIIFSLYDGKKLPYSDNSFDLITCLMVLHHIPKDNLDALISEIYRVMKPNGVLILREHDVNNAAEILLLDMMHDFYDYVWNVIETKATEQWGTNYKSRMEWNALITKTGFTLYTQPSIFRHDKLNPFMSYMCSYFKPSIVDTSGQMNMFRIIPDNLPREQYKRRTKEIKSVLHWGQRKLSLTEIEFFTLYLQNMYTPENSGKHIYAVYAGSAPGTHILYLAKLFPTIHFELYDPREFSKKLLKNTKMINTYVQYFTDETAQQWVAANHPDKVILLISDIRTGEPEKQSKEMVEARVKIDHEWQKNWYNIIKPEMAMFKFRLPWNDEITEYLAGDIYIQPYPPATSTETRLIIGKDAGLKMYDNRKYEEQFFYFNNHIRPLNFANILDDLTPDEKHGVKNNYDGAAEVHILEQYLNMKYGASSTQSKRHIKRLKIIDMIKNISDELSIHRTMYSNQPVKAHKKDTLIKLQQLGYIPKDIILDQTVFDTYVVPRYDFFKEKGLI